MAANRAREPRQPVRIGARLRSGQGWSDVVLHNVSTRGVMGECRHTVAEGYGVAAFGPRFASLLLREAGGGRPLLLTLDS
jgi:hypothetical protein